MPVNLSAPNPSDLHPVPGVKLGITMAGVRKANRRDLTVITLDEGRAVADPPPPSQRWLDIVIAGAEAHGLPELWIAELKRRKK